MRIIHAHTIATLLIGAAASLPLISHAGGTTPGAPSGAYTSGTASVPVAPKAAAAAAQAQYRVVPGVAVAVPQSLSNSVNNAPSGAPIQYVGSTGTFSVTPSSDKSSFVINSVQAPAIR